jgi:hypothetical protein
MTEKMGYHIRTLLLTAALVATGCNAAPLGTPDADFNILFVGNSLTRFNDLPSMLEMLMDSHGDVGDVHVESVALPGYGLQDHWSEGTARRRLAEGAWDYVIIQQGPSATEGRPSLLAFSALFTQEASAAGARLALFMVWPSIDRLFDFDGVLDSYRTAAVQNGGLLFPAGEAWREAWALDPDVSLYDSDGFHPSALGTYLAALVMYQQLTGKDPRLLPPEIRNSGGRVTISAELAGVLQTAATTANAKHALP